MVSTFVFFIAGILFTCDFFILSFPWLASTIKSYVILSFVFLIKAFSYINYFDTLASTEYALLKTYIAIYSYNKRKHALQVGPIV